MQYHLSNIAQSKHYNSYHQIIGFIVLAGLVVQLGLGLIHHAFYMKSKQPTPFGRIHFFLGPFIIIMGIINGGLGIHFAGKKATSFALLNRETDIYCRELQTGDPIRRGRVRHGLHILSQLHRLLYPLKKDDIQTRPQREGRSHQGSKRQRV